MNQKLGALFAFVFLLGAGIFNIAVGTSYIHKRNRNHVIGWIRIVVGTVLLLAAVLLYRQLRASLF